MTELREEHFEVIDRNKAKAKAHQDEMRKESIEFVGSCSVYDLQVVYKSIKDLINKRYEGK